MCSISSIKIVRKLNTLRLFNRMLHFIQSIKIRNKLALFGANDKSNNL